MSLVDADKHSEDRGSPTPNHSDVLPSEGVKAHKTISSHYSSDADTSNTRLQMQNKQLIGNNGTSQIVNYGVQSDGNFALKFFDANGVGVARFGQYADGSIALKVAKSGQEVDTATGNNLVFNSAQDTFKIVSSGTASFVVSSLASGATSTSTLAHGLGIVPAVIAYVNGTGSTYLTAGRYYSVPTTVPVAVGGKYEAGVQYWFQADSTNIYFNVSNYSSVGPITDVGTASFKYYLLQESAS